MDKILLSDIFKFDELLSQPEYKGRRIKLRFNKNWWNGSDYYDFVVEYLNKSADFLPYLLSCGSDKRSRNQNNDIQFQFIEVEYHKWLFVGAYIILEKDSQVHRANFGGYHVKYALAERLEEYDKYIDKLLVSWINSPRSFFYTDYNKIRSAEIISISNISYFERQSNFPGYTNLSLSYQDLKRHWNDKTWYEHLSSVYGVYVITDTKTGKLYVGSAYGDDGIYGRWSAYLKNGYDKSELEESRYPNKKLKILVNQKGIKYIQEHFQYSILEIFSKSELGKQKALEREAYWKNVLKTRKFGYNAN